MGVTVPPSWDSILELSSSVPPSELPILFPATSLEALALPTEQRVSAARGDPSSCRPRVDANTSLITVLLITGKMEETAGNTEPEQGVTTAEVTEVVTAEVVPG